MGVFTMLVKVPFTLMPRSREALCIHCFRGCYEVNDLASRQRSGLLLTSNWNQIRLYDGLPVFYRLIVRTIAVV